MKELECRLENGKIFEASRNTNNEYECEIELEFDHNITFWSKFYGESFQISSNYISLFYLQQKNISFGTNSKQQGYISQKYEISISFPLNSIPSRHLKSDNFDSTLNGFAKNITISGNGYKFEVENQVQGISKINTNFLMRNVYQLASIRGMFLNNRTLNISGTGNQGNIVNIHLNTLELISKNEIRSDCKDIVVTFKNVIIGRMITSCHSSDTIISFNLIEGIDIVDINHSIYYGNEFCSTENTSFSTDATAPVSYSWIDNQPIKFKLSSIDLNFIFLKTFNISSVSTSSSFINRAQKILIHTDRENADFSNLLEYSIKYPNYEMLLNLTNFETFNGSIYSNVSNEVQFSIFAKHKVTNEYLEISSKKVFYFWNTTNLLHFDPFIDKFNSSSTSISKNITITTDHPILTDFSLFCKIYQKNSIDLVKSEKKTPNMLTCFLNATNLHLNSELINFGLFVIDGSENQFEITSQNLSYVILKEPIQLTGIDEVIAPNNFENSFQLDFDDYSATNDVSFQNYTFITYPQLHSPLSFNCSSIKSKINCSIPKNSFDYTPIKLDNKLIIKSKYFSKEVSFEVVDLYFKEEIEFLTEYPFLIDKALYQGQKMKIYFNSTKKLNPSFQFYCLCK